MPIFKITEERASTHYWIYEVEAETEALAIEMIEEGEVEAIASDEEVDFCAESHYIVEPFKNN